MSTSDDKNGWVPLFRKKPWMAISGELGICILLVGISCLVPSCKKGKPSATGGKRPPKSTRTASKDPKLSSKQHKVPRDVSPQPGKIELGLREYGWRMRGDIFEPQFTVCWVNKTGKFLRDVPTTQEFGLHFKNGTVKQWNYDKGNLAGKWTPFRPNETKVYTVPIYAGYHEKAALTDEIFDMRRWAPYGLKSVELRCSWVAKDPFGFLQKGTKSFIKPIPEAILRKFRGNPPAWEGWQPLR